MEAWKTLAHGAVKFLLRVLEAAFLVILLGVGILAWRLSQGPVAINVVAPYVASALEVLNPGFRFQIEHAEFRWRGFEGQPQLVIRDVRVLNPAGSVIAGLPTLIAFLSVPALLNGDIAPERINLSNPIIRFVHRSDGTFALGVEGAATPESPQDASGNVLLAALIGSLTTPPSAENPTGYLQSVSIDGTTLTLVDETSGRRWLTPDATLGFSRDGGSVELLATLPISEEGKTWDVTARGRYVAETNALNVAFSIDDFRPARIADLAPQLSILQMIDIGFNGIIAADFTLEGNGARISGVRFDVTGNAGRILRTSPTPASYPVQSVSLRGVAGDSLDRIAVDEFAVVLSREGEIAPAFKMSAVAENLNSTPSIQADAALSELTIEALKDLWPEDIKPNTRDWIMKNLSGGRLANLQANLQLSGSDLESIEATNLSLFSELSGLSVKYIEGLPRVHGVGGIMTAGLDDVLFDLREGYVPDSSAKNLRVSRGLLRMHNLGSRGTELADFDINIVGDFGSVMRLIDHQPLGYATSMGVDADSAVGRASVDLALDFPLVRDLKLDQIDIEIEAAVTDVGIPNVAFNLPLAKGLLDITLDRDGMDVSGSAHLGEIPVSLEWRENFTGGEFRSKYLLTPVVGNAHRPSIGLGVAPFTPPYIDGPVAANIVYTVNRDLTASLMAEVDLTESAVAIPELSWSKEAGVLASADVVASFFDGNLKDVSSFEVRASEELLISGSATFGAETKLSSLIIKPSTVGDTMLAGEVHVSDAGDYDIEIVGPALNGASFLREAKFGEDETQNVNDEIPNSPSVELSAKFDQIWFTPGEPISDVSLIYRSDSEGVQFIDFASKVDTGTSFDFKLSGGPDGRTFYGSSDDGGSVMRAVGLFDDIEGGRLEVSGTLNAEGIASGLAKVDEFQLVDAPIVARLLSVAALTGILDELRGEGISFKTLRVPFSFANSALSINDGEMFGNSLGLTGEGHYNFADSTMNFEGTLIPAYAINSALNSVPLLGPLLTAGDKGGGIFAATYSYQGDVATAQPTVNPLAVLAPGFLRNIFDIFKDSPSDISSDPSRTPEAGSPNFKEDAVQH